MSYRGSAIQYRIRKTTTNNATGDNFSITVPRIVAHQFESIFFKLSISGNCLIFESGCKVSIHDIEKENINHKKISSGKVVFI